jgi:hypothetical protein
MKKYRIYVFLILAILVLSSQIALAEKMDWAFIQAVGGISVGEPLRTEDGFYLPIDCDVSGLKQVTVKPTTINSALICSKIYVSIKDKNIYITISTGLPGGRDNSQCSAVRIGYPESGDYTVFYKDPKGPTYEISKTKIVR